MEAELFREINGRFLLNSVTPLFVFLLFKGIRLYMIYSNLKNFSSFNFEISRQVDSPLQPDFRCFTGAVRTLDLPIISN